MSPWPVAPGGRHDALARALDLDVDSSGVCLACLCFVSFPLDDGDERLARSWARWMSRDIWEDGLAVPLLAALARANDDGVPEAEAALLNARTRGSRSPVVHAFVLRLAAELVERSHVEAAVLPQARARSSGCTPELN